MIEDPPSLEPDEIAEYDQAFAACSNTLAFMAQAYVEHRRKDTRPEPITVMEMVTAFEELMPPRAVASILAVAVVQYARAAETQP